MEIDNVDAAFVYTGEEEVLRDVTSMMAHPSVTDIPNEVFLRCKMLKNVVLSESIQSIGNQAFQHCDALKSVER